MIESLDPKKMHDHHERINKLNRLERLVLDEGAMGKTEIVRSVEMSKSTVRIYLDIAVEEGRLTVMDGAPNKGVSRPVYRIPSPFDE